MEEKTILKISNTDFFLSKGWSSNGKEGKDNLIMNIKQDNILRYGHKAEIIEQDSESTTFEIECSQAYLQKQFPSAVLITSGMEKVKCSICNEEWMTDMDTYEALQNHIDLFHGGKVPDPNEDKHLNYYNKEHTRLVEEIREAKKMQDYDRLNDLRCDLFELNQQSRDNQDE